MKTASWILREKGTKKVVCETFDRAKVEALNTAKYEAVPILEYLQELNDKPNFGMPPPFNPKRPEPIKAR